MLVLTRKPLQSISIGGNTTVTVLGIDRNRVKLGFSAPDDVGILREELVGTEGKPHTHEKTGGMLVLDRKVREGVAIGENTLLKVLGIDRHRVKVGIDAPSDVSINRGELITEGRAHHGSKERL